MIPKWLFAIRGKVPTATAIVLGAIPVLLMFGIWWAVTFGSAEQRVVSPTILPSPAEVFAPKASVVPLLERGLVRDALISLRRVGLSYVLALAVALPLGILMGSFGSVRSLFAPTTTASGYIPIAALVPLIMSWVEGDENRKLVFLGLAFLIYLVPVIVRAIDGVPDVYLRTASTLGASRWQTIWRVLIPIALPDIWAGMRLAFGVGWTYLVLAELLIIKGGLGELIFVSQRKGPREHIYLVILVITLIAWAADLGWVRLGQLLFPYKRTSR